MGRTQLQQSAPRSDSALLALIVDERQMNLMTPRCTIESQLASGRGFSCEEYSVRALVERVLPASTRQSLRRLLVLALEPMSQQGAGHSTVSSREATRADRTARVRESVRQPGVPARRAAIRSFSLLWYRTEVPWPSRAPAIRSQPRRDSGPGVACDEFLDVLKERGLSGPYRKLKPVES